MKAPTTQYRVLIVEDNATMREGMYRVVEKMNCPASQAEDAEQALQLLREESFDIVISDYKLPGMHGLDLLKKIKQKTPKTEVLIITAYGTIELAVEAIKSGAADFITKPFSPEELSIKLTQIFEKIARLSELERLSQENLYLREREDERFNFGDIIGRSPVMQSIFQTIEKVARGDSSVIIYGESGTGKELVARAIHKASPRKDRPFVRINCGALAEGVLESELFGHERGAFTGALKRKKGRFELAHTGSIFLDEIGDVPLNTQVKLLRVLQEKEFERVGGEETLTVDVRVIAATHKNLQEEIAQGRFREDLYYRLHIIPITLPPLRDRKQDIPVLTRHFLEQLRSELNLPELEIEESALERLQDYHWPGNVRELQNVLERAAVLCDRNTITPKDLPILGASSAGVPGASAHDLDLNRALERLERQLIEQAMDKADGVKTTAARLLNIKPSALYYKLEKYGML